MTVTFLAYQAIYLSEMTRIWNEIIEDGVAFPGEKCFTEQDFSLFLAEQTIVTCLFYGEELAGFYVVHPNNIGRCSHVANASYCLDKTFRGKKLFSSLVENSLICSKEAGFKGMQYNAVVTSNEAAIHTYKKNGFGLIGTITNGFKLKSGILSDMHIMYREL